VKQVLGKSIGSALIGVVIGAVVIGGVWYGVSKKNENRVVATVGGTPITRTAFMTQLESSGGSQTLNGLIGNQLIEYGAAKYHITANQADLDKAKQGVEQQLGITTDAQLQTALAGYHMTMADFQKNMRITVLEQKLAQRNVTVTDADVQKYYDQNKAQMTVNGKTPALNDVKAQIVDAIKQSKQQSTADLLASLAKEYPIQIVDTTYNDVKNSIENPQPAQAPTTP
jgi:foldase protein PrsA